MSDQHPVTPEVDPLPELEADLAAVEAALASLDRLDAEGRTGDAVVAEIRAVVDPGRFGQPSPGSSVGPVTDEPADERADETADVPDPVGTDSDLVGDGLDGEQVDPLADPPRPA